MRIAHVLKDLDPAYGGTVTAPLNMARATAQLGHDVEIWTADAFGWEPAADASAAGSLQLVERPGRAGLGGRAFLDRFRDDIDRVDLVHTHTLWRPYVARFISACHAAGRPTVHTMHGMLMDWPFQQKTLKKRLFLRLFGARALRDVQAVQFLNHGEVQQSRHVGVDMRYFVLPNGVDTSEFAALPPRGTYRQTEPALADHIIILSLGRLHHVKGCDLLLDAFLELAEQRDDIALIMAGPDEGMRSSLDQRLQGHRAADRVLMPGLVTGGLRASLLSDADIFAQCSHHETASMSILEGAYARNAMLITDRCNCSEVAEYDAGVVVETSTASVRKGLSTLLESHAKLRSYGDQAHQMVEDRFTLARVMPMLVEHYQRIISGEVYPRLLSPSKGAR